MNNFRLSNKKIHKDSRSSIENKHEEKMKEIEDYYLTLESKQDNLINLKEIYTVLLQSRDKIKIQQRMQIKYDIEELETEIYNIKNQTELIDYLSSAMTFLRDIDNQDTTSLKCSEETEQNSILNYVTKIGETNKGKDYNRYINKCFNGFSDSPNENKKICKNCESSDFEHDHKESQIICSNCGIIIDNIMNQANNLNYADTCIIENTVQPFFYQRKNHFKEWLNQLQGREVTVIPDSVIELVLLEIKKERITDINVITSIKMKSFLKKLKLNKYYEHIPNLINRITNKSPLEISVEFYDILLELFDKIQTPFKKHCPSNRKNFLSYSYTLHKFCQLLDKTEYLIYFPLLKSREKLFEQEKIWKGICTELNWKFIASI